MTDTPLLGRVHVDAPEKPGPDGWRRAGLRWECVIDGKTHRHRQAVGKLSRDCGKRQWQEMVDLAHLAAARKTEELNRPAATTTPDKPLQAAVTDYLCALEGTREPVTIDALQRTLEGFLAFAAGQPDPPATVAAVEYAHVKAWMAARQAWVKDSTARKELCGISAFFAEALRLRWRLAPIELPKPPRLPAPRPTVPEDAQVFAALREQEPLKRAAFVALACTGMRNDELHGLPPSAWSRASMTLSLPETGSGRTKLHARTLPVGETLAEALDVFVAQGGIPGKPGTLNRWLKRYGMVPRELRRWFNTTLKRMHAPEYVVRCLMGHSLGGTAAAYDGYRPSDAKDWMLRVDAKVSGALREELLGCVEQGIAELPRLRAQFPRLAEAGIPKASVG